MVRRGERSFVPIPDTPAATPNGEGSRHRKGRCPHDMIAMNAYARSGGPQFLTKIKSGSTTSSDF
jgi:hypothetical protein